MQKDVFVNGEADAYFRRNPNPIADLPLVELYGSYAGNRVLEIGCSGGARLAEIASRAEGYGVDPSLEAVAAGRAAFPHLHLSVGTADKLDFPDSHFDLVLFGFCLYLIDRALLFRSIAEADRVLQTGGVLGLWDFDPITPKKRIYRHAPGVWSYKADYSKLFLANPAYSLIDKRVVFEPTDPSRRVSAWILRKSADGYAYEPD